MAAQRREELRAARRLLMMAVALLGSGCGTATDQTAVLAAEPPPPLPDASECPSIEHALDRFASCMRRDAWPAEMSLEAVATNDDQLCADCHDGPTGRIGWIGVSGDDSFDWHRRMPGLLGILAVRLDDRQCAQAFEPSAYYSEAALRLADHPAYVLPDVTREAIDRFVTETAATCPLVTR